jgi:hypothetical protein
MTTDKIKSRNEKPDGERRVFLFLTPSVSYRPKRSVVYACRGLFNL